MPHAMVHFCKKQIYDHLSCGGMVGTVREIRPEVKRPRGQNLAIILSNFDSVLIGSTQNSAQQPCVALFPQYTGSFTAAPITGRNRFQVEKTPAVLRPKQKNGGCKVFRKNRRDQGLLSFALCGEAAGKKRRASEKTGVRLCRE